MQQKEGWWSAFWLQSPVIGSTLNPKISGVEVEKEVIAFDDASVIVRVTDENTNARITEANYIKPQKSYWRTE